MEINLLNVDSLFAFLPPLGLLKGISPDISPSLQSGETARCGNVIVRKGVTPVAK